ncbi:MAG: hypothetical protein HC913_04865 [Microscillaceae bacterium]|nr:hypothetical protein [Microscillaceae bacterium]
MALYLNLLAMLMFQSLKAFKSFYIILATFSFLGCAFHSERAIEVVTYAQFEEFVSQTAYVTDAEKYGWSIVQTDVYHSKR